MERQERCNQSQGDGYYRYDGGAHIAQEEEEYDNYKYTTLDERALYVVDRALDESALAEDVCTDANIVRQILLHILQSLFYFAGQFKGLDPAQKKLSVTKDGGDIDAITASTITSRAFVNGVATAVNVLSAIAGTPMLIDTATGASSTEWTAPADTTKTK